MKDQVIRVSEDVDIIFSETNQPHLYVRLTTKMDGCCYPPMNQDGSISYVHPERLTSGQMEQVRKAYDLLGRQFRIALAKK